MYLSLKPPDKHSINPVSKNIKFNPIFSQTVTVETDINANLESVNHPICTPNT